MRQQFMRWKPFLLLKTSTSCLDFVRCCSAKRTERKHFSRKVWIQWKPWTCAAIYCSGNKRLRSLKHWHPNKFRSSPGNMRINLNSRWFNWKFEEKNRFRLKSYPLAFNCRNRYAEALVNYEKGVDKTALTRIQLSDAALDEHKRLCEFGIARTNIKLGNYKKGVRIIWLIHFESKNLLKSKTH